MLTFCRRRRHFADSCAYANGPFRTHGLRFIPETGFDLHCLVEPAVQLAKFSALAAERGCFAMRHKRCSIVNGRKSLVTGGSPLALESALHE
jgi:hypothetical protein